ncbi:CPA2 family monovalent cation:H+ antiporter-2 [Novosphingobium chloroacetimidivorans]|uniref:CPA2 family monovalent cation:H+ antiporter-2 n=1 Tax=Novosphingobium chloroacetimidivorans TaxID=1428314 RepID=A0A7W7K798_9SPHN|nr:cation:proton antiporter [Novosphingobium chloroacetimidivorans]MBB4856903.1 CPA2 family monovalent cation:H+ antiporter-2 [Novosphingobium chloroacetimidivorans]
MAANGELYSPLVSDALVILGAAGAVIPIFARFRITPVIGFILVGLLVGPTGLGRLVPSHPWLYHFTISDPEGLDLFAEFGIILLLFSIGLELSFGRLWQMRRQVFGLGSLELLGIGAAITAVLALVGHSLGGALALGLALTLSSTALVLKITSTATPVGRAALAMLLFEDIALVPIIFLLGAIGPNAESGFGAIAGTIALGIAVVAALLIGGRFMLPPLFAQAARTKSPELFLAASLLVVILASLATAAAGLSPIVGALIAGLLIAETEYHVEVEHITEPFKGLALGVFLITVGMSIDFAVVAQNLVAILVATVGVIALKALVTGLLLRVMGARRGTAMETGILMSSPSETTLIVLTAATAAQLITPATEQFWQIVTALGLTITPLLALFGRSMGRQLDGALPATSLPDEQEPRAIIVGFGRVGRLVADMLKAHDKPYVAVDSDTDLVTEGKHQGYVVTFGDAARGSALDRLGANNATAVILTMDEPVSTQRLVRKLRGEYPDLPIIVRARDTTHAAELYRAGASQAVPETLESSLQLSEAVLVDLGVPMGPVIASIHEKRDELRIKLMEEGGLTEKPSLRSSSLRERPA